MVLASSNVSAELLVQHFHRPELGLVDVRQFLVQCVTVHHRNRPGSVLFELKLHQVLHERHIWSDLGSSGLHVVVGVLQAHPVVLDEVRQAEGRRPTNSSHTVDQRYSTDAHGLLLDPIGHLVKVPVQIRFAVVLDRNPHVAGGLIAGQWSVGKFLLGRGVDHQRNAQLLHRRYAGSTAPAEVQIAEQFGHAGEAEKNGRKFISNAGLLVERGGGGGSCLQNNKIRARQQGQQRFWSDRKKEEKDLDFSQWHRANHL